ncbi:hypothetical protein BC835DRAFT_1258152, partial [Cytidiella melzeri]
IALPREYQFIWKAHWMPVKVAYLLCCYWVIAVILYLLWAFCTNHTVEECEKIYCILIALAMWNQVTSEVILVIRTYAIFNHNNYILTLLVVALAGVVDCQLYVDTSEMLLLPFLQETGPCLPMSKPHSVHLLGFFVSAVLVMTVVKAITICHRSGGPRSQLIQTFLCKGVKGYVSSTASLIWNKLICHRQRQSISAICIPLSVMLFLVLACRLVVELRERGAQTVAQSTGTMAFTAGVSYSKSSPSSPFSGGFGFISNRTGARIIMQPQGEVLSTLGSIPGD